ncbi:MAG: YegS/Rv2252/BmrU family lipid kinase [Clostridia bacterium]|nr:YegS/Rv2252/BmrU family lipid kinase [Clostridia bacterium]
MKHIFVINPNAGKASYVDELSAKLAQLEGYDIEIYVTKDGGDATKYVKQICEKMNSPVRFYACGGDGTIKEVVDGMCGYEFAELSCYPCGSGNDFVKCYGDVQAFDDLKKLLESKASYIDLIKINGQYSINVINCGFDTYVASTMAKVKRKKFIGGKRAYTTGVVAALFNAMVNKADIWVDGERINDGKFLLMSIANGQFYGGAYRCAPLSLNNDGLLDVCMVKCVSIFTFLKLIKIYKLGGHLNNPKFAKILKYKRAKKIIIEGGADFCVTVDGELLRGKTFEIEVVPSAIRFAAPAPFILDNQQEEQTIFSITNG